MNFRNPFTLKLPNLQKLILKNIKNINLSDIPNLKYYDGDEIHLSILKSEALENIKVLSKENNSFEMERKTIEKIISFNNLKEFSLTLKQFDANITDKIIGENKSVIKINLDNTYLLVNFLTKFPNLLELHIDL